MSTQTPNLHLTKQDGNEGPSRTSLNGNWDILDEAVGNNASDISNIQAVLSSIKELKIGKSTVDIAAGSAGNTKTVYFDTPFDDSNLIAIASQQTWITDYDKNCIVQVRDISTTGMALYAVRKDATQPVSVDVAWLVASI